MVKSMMALLWPTSGRSHCGGGSRGPGCRSSLTILAAVTITTSLPLVFGEQPFAKVPWAFATVRPVPRSHRRGGSDRGGAVVVSAANVIDGGGYEDNGGGGVYRPFASYAWTKLAESGLFLPEFGPGESDGGGVGTVPDDLRSNTSAARGRVDGSRVNVEVRSMRGIDGGPIRLARYALLETMDPADGREGETVCAANAIHVLNLVAFPNPEWRGCGGEPLPVLGMDLVSLPGDKHLVAIDFQPLTPLPETEERRVLPERYIDFESLLEGLHRRHCIESDKLPWGGDIPPQAQRYFSPRAVWTRLLGPEALGTVQGAVWSAYQDYLDLYLELMLQAKRDTEGGPDDSHDAEEEEEAMKGALEGQRSYLEYRRANDPARPMLKSLYGEEWTERLIEEVLFQHI
eukprot:CAMPEP_0183306256 /NCGR_PEP_ID=MMETSP0160_2-20130417/10738_1 /TAXON_ID=2839 ORGANISM="Odontella Sinensis, Strain Grunow 1884" /NCGR_SAMPLE_ID=MMETSP0160_2 /ASSEMBLY_ACC=CAM_ASM_000250 /LENGTH=401 /DNA_ID=CAMNT_0025469599 /DNA_START=20 /DNA_END=1225 /DNA_ORIENTATION=+